jgi:hypothetical protein
MHDNMLHSIATSIGMDVILIRRLDKGRQSGQTAFDLI